MNSLYIHRLYHKVLFVAVGKESCFGLEYEWRQTTVKIEEKPALSISANNIATGNLFSENKLKQILTIEKQMEKYVLFAVAFLMFSFFLM